MQFDKPIALAADHGGYELKEAIKAHLTADASGVLETRAYGCSLLPMRCAPE